jgi:hypothetical protein
MSEYACRCPLCNAWFTDPCDAIQCKKCNQYMCVECAIEHECKEVKDGKVSEQGTENTIC